MSKHKTPLRYPGGKQKLAPFITEILEANSLLGGHYIEPYAGGSGIAIELLLNDVVSHIHLNDISLPVYAFWRSVKKEPEELCRRISRASLNVDEWKKQKNILKYPKDKDLIDVGYAMFFLNRCNRSGILTGGIIGGLNQLGSWKIDARFSRNDLIRRIEAIAEKSKLISLRNWDAEKFMLQYLPKLPKNSLVYCDPPYFNKARTLYQNHYSPTDHLRISRIIKRKIKLPWVVSYDAHPSILSYYKKCKVFVYPLQYNASKAYIGTEVFAFSNKLTIPSFSSLEFIDKALKSSSTSTLATQSIA